MDANRLGIALAVSLMALGAVVLADVVAADLGRSSSTLYHEKVFRDQDVVAVSTVGAGAGDIVRVRVPSELPDPFSGHRMLVVRGGTGGLLDGPRPQETVLLDLRGDEATDGQARYVQVPGGSRNVDIVRVYTYAQTPPQDEQAALYFEEWVRSAAARVPTTPDVTASSAVTFHRLAVPAMWILMVASTVLGVLWIRSTRPTPKVEGIALVELGVRALAFLRRLLVWLVPLLVVGAWAALIFFWNVGHAVSGFGPDWAATLRMAIAFLLAVAAVGWALVMLRVQRAHRRWKAHAARFPLD